VTYELSDLGRSFADQVAGLVAWSLRHKSEIETAQAAYDTRPET
jgi:DNA-binding HxlR family transcriptional regulator